MSNRLPTEQNPTLEISEFTTWTQVGSDRLIAKRGAEPICLEGDACLLGAILSGLETPTSIEMLARRLKTGREVLKVHVEALLDAGLVSAKSPPAAGSPSKPFVESIVVMNHDPLCAEGRCHGLSAGSTS